MWKLQFGKKNESVETDPKKKKKVVLTDTNVGQGYTLAECCHPIPGDPVLGYLDEYGTVLVHKRECPVALKLKSNYGNRIVTAEWATHNVKSFLAMIEINGIDERCVLQKLLLLFPKITPSISKVCISRPKTAFSPRSLACMCTAPTI